MCLSFFSLLLEYLALDKQLDSLNTALDVLEKRSDNLQEDALQFLRDTRAARGDNESSGEEEEANVSGKDEEKESGQNDDKNSGVETEKNA